MTARAPTIATPPEAPRAPPRTVVTCKLPAEHLAMLDRLAVKLGNRSEAIRVAIERLHERMVV